MRTALYFMIMLISIVAMTGAVMAQRQLAPRFGAWSATLMAASVHLAVTGAAAMLLPAVNEVPDGFPAVLLWRFRMASMGIQAVMWTTIGLGFGMLAEQVVTGAGGSTRDRMRAAIG